MIILLDIAVCLWIIFFGGASHVIGFMGLFYPGIDEFHVKFFAWIMLFTAPIYYFLI